ncbi:unnamed protein product [Scytosiphon promiscuus]
MRPGEQVSPPPPVGARRRLLWSGCSGSWCKPQVLSAEATPANPSVSALAADMLERGWVTPEEHRQLLLGDRMYSLHEAATEEQERQLRRRERKRMGLAGKLSLSKQSRLGIVKRARSQRKAQKVRSRPLSSIRPPLGRRTVALVQGAGGRGCAQFAPVKKKKKQPSPAAERPADICRDPITLDDLGSWTWDFRASEAATPPVSCGATSAMKFSGAWLGRRGGSGIRFVRATGEDGRLEALLCSTGRATSCLRNLERDSRTLPYHRRAQEPTTRRPFSLVQLADLDALAAKAGAKVKGSLVTSYHEGQDKYRERRERREMLVGADRCLGDIVSEMLSTIEDTEESHEEAHVYLCTLFPQFAHIFSEIKEADEEFARQCLEQQIALLRGPPNRPTAKSLSSEQGDLLRACVDFLSEQGAGSGGGANDVERGSDYGGGAGRSGGWGRGGGGGGTAAMFGGRDSGGLPGHGGEGGGASVVAAAVAAAAAAAVDEGGTGGDTTSSGSDDDVAGDGVCWDGSVE